MAAPVIAGAQNYQKTTAGVKASVNGVTVDIRFYSPEIVRVTKAPGGKLFAKESLSVIKKPQQTAISIKQQGDVLNLRSEKLNVSINLKSGDIAYATSKGKALLKEKPNGATFTPFDDAGDKTYTISQAFLLDKGEAEIGRAHV